MTAAEEPASSAEPVRIAMWSGPRNLSAALMRSFGNRPDGAFVDEPFYAAYLDLSGADHPMREAILRRHAADWRKVAHDLAGPAWYDAVSRSIGFVRPSEMPQLTDPRLKDLEEQALPVYRRLAGYVLG